MSRSRPRRYVVLLALAALLAAACSRPTDRPREGAQPVGAGGPVGRLVPQAPPTLAPATRATVTPIPEPEGVPAPEAVVVASPATSGGIYPIVSNLQPPPDAALPPGEVVIGARVTSATNLVDVVAFVDGDPFQPDFSSRPSRSLVFSFTRQLEIGPHEVRIQARDERGHGGAYRWQFTVGARQPLPTVTPAPLLDVAPVATLGIRATPTRDSTPPAAPAPPAR